MSARLQVLFLTALLGALAAVGLLVAAVAGPWVALAYAVVALGVLAVAAARARQAARRAAGHTCDCCSTTVHDEVTVR